MPRERAHTQLGSARIAQQATDGAPRAAPRRMVAASALGALSGLRPWSALGAGYRLPRAQALGTGVALCAALAASQRPILGTGSVQGRRSRGSEARSSLVRELRGRSEYQAELGSLRTLFFALGQIWVQATDFISTLEASLFFAPPSVCTVNRVTDPIAIVEDKPVSPFALSHLLRLLTDNPPASFVA